MGDYSVGRGPDFQVPKQPEEETSIEEEILTTPETKLFTQVQKELEKAIDARDEEKINKFLKRVDAVPTAHMVHTAIFRRLPAIASRILGHSKLSCSPQEWSSLVYTACKKGDNQLLVQLMSKMPPHALQDLFNEALKQHNEKKCLFLARLFLTMLPKEHLQSLPFSALDRSFLLRYGVQISTEATLSLIALSPLEHLLSPEARDFLFASAVRAKNGDPRLMQALIDRGVDFQALYRQEAHIAAEKGQAYLAASVMLEKHSETKKPIEATIADSTETVILAPKEGVVLKKGKQEATREQEERIANLFHLAKAGGVLSSIRLKAVDAQFAMGFFATQPQTEDLQNIEAKPFATGMKTVDELMRSPRLCEEAFRRLDRNSQVNALLLSEFQLYDLHTQNLGLRVARTPETELFVNTTFSFASSYDAMLPLPWGLKATRVSFDQLVAGYIEGKIDETTVISYSVDGVEKKERLGQLPELLKALKEAPYELVIFDTDKNFAETNGVHFGDFSEGYKGHYIPLRSCLLEVSFKDRPVPREVIDMARKNDKLILDWLWSSTSPIYHFMNEDEKDWVMETIRAWAADPDYSVTLSRTVRECRRGFSLDAAQLSTEFKQGFWKKMEEILSDHGYFKPYVVRARDTVESIANHFQIEPMELKALNPEFDLSELQVGMELRVKPKLTSDLSGLALRKQIARELFPKASCFQVRAYEKRIQARNTYLRSVDKLASLRKQEGSEQTISTLKRILKRSSTPLSSFQKDEFYEKLKPNIDSRALKKIVDDLAEAIKPTYFNFMKAMYPLLADSWEILAILYGKKAGWHVGLFTTPIEQIIKDFKAKKVNDEDSKKKLRYLEEGLAREIARSQLRNHEGKPVCKACW